MDIDSFLNKFEKDIKEKKEEFDLEFQKDVEDRISKIQEGVQNKDIGLLKDIYDVIKRFDQDLPNKFLGIENQGGLALQNLGKQYSQKFLNINLNNAKIIKEQIIKNFKIIDENLKINNFNQVLQSLKEIKIQYSQFPKTLINEKIQISNLVKKKEIEIYNNLEIFKSNETKRIKNDLNKIIQELKKNLMKKNIKLIEKSINEIRMFLNNIPKVILSHFTQDKIKVNKVLEIAESYLLKCYREEFNYRIKVINLLIEKFHANKVKKQVKTCVLIYNEILIEFKNIPEVFLKEKIELYNKINELFTQLNNLLIKDNIEMFLESYNHSKKIEATREYLRHAKESKTINHKNLNLIKKEIKKLPEKLNYEKQDISNDLEQLGNKIKNQKELPSMKKISQTNSNLNNIKKIEFNKKDKLSKNVNVNMLKEIEIYYKRLIKSNNETEVTKLYEKILFYLKLVRIPRNKKVQILQKVKQTLKEKNIMV